MPGTAGPPTTPPLPLAASESDGSTRRTVSPLLFPEAAFALLALAAALLTAYQVDALIYHLRLRSRQTFEFLPVLWAPAVANFVLGFGLLLIVWWLGRRSARQPWIGLAYVIAGVAAVIYLPLLLTFDLHRFGVPTLGALLVQGPMTYWSVTGTVLAITGLLHLLPRRSTASH
jgi:hypothetical protein